MLHNINSKMRGNSVGGAGGDEGGNDISQWDYIVLLGAGSFRLGAG